MEGISLIGLPLLELLEEPVDVLLVFELATELDDRSERGIPCEGGGGGAEDEISTSEPVDYFLMVNPLSLLKHKKCKKL